MRLPAEFYAEWIVNTKAPPVQIQVGQYGLSEASLMQDELISFSETYSLRAVNTEDQ